MAINMKLLKIVLIAVLIIPFSLNSQVLLDENFDYPAGDSLGAHGWVGFSSFVNVITVATPGLTFTGYPLSGIGNHCHLRNNGQDAYKGFDSVITGSVYCAFMVKVDSVKAAGDYFFAFLAGTSTTNYTARFYVRDSAGTASFGVSKGTLSNSPVVWGPNGYSLLTSYLVVVKYTFLTGSNTDDEIRVYIFNSTIPGTEPGSATIGPVTSTAVNDAGNLGRIALRQGSASSSPTLNIDGIRVFKSWSNIIGIITISTIAEKFSLSQNYPNPFNPNTNIRFSIPERGNVSLKIFDLLGKEVSNLVDGNYSTGIYEVDFEGKGFSSGTYIYRMSFTSESGKNFVDTKKMLMIK